MPSTSKLIVSQGQCCIPDIKKHSIEVNINGGMPDSKRLHHLTATPYSKLVCLEAFSPPVHSKESSHFLQYFFVLPGYIGFLNAM